MQKYMLKSGSGHLKGGFLRAIHDASLAVALILEMLTQHLQSGFSQGKQILFEVAFSIYMIFEEF